MRTASSGKKQKSPIAGKRNVTSIRGTKEDNPKTQNECRERSNYIFRDSIPESRLSPKERTEGGERTRREKGKKRCTRKSSSMIPRGTSARENYKEPGMRI